MVLDLVKGNFVESAGNQITELGDHTRLVSMKQVSLRV